MELSEDSKRRITKVLEGDASVEVLLSSVELHQLMLQYNWDNGDEVVAEVVSSPLLDRGTALMVYFLSGPATCEIAAREECRDWELDLYDYIVKLENRLLDDDFQFREIQFDPKEFVNFDGGWSSVPGYKRVPPEPLCSPTPGEPMPEMNLTYELTPEEERQLEEESDLDNLAAWKEMEQQDPSFRENRETFERFFLKKYGYKPD